MTKKIDVDDDCATLACIPDAVEPTYFEGEVPKVLKDKARASLPSYMAAEVTMQQAEEAEGPPVRWTRKVSAAIKLLLTGEQEELQLIEGWCAVGHLEELSRKHQVITGGQASATDIIRVGLHAKDKTLGASMFHILNWRGGWWLKEKPYGGRWPRGRRPHRGHRHYRGRRRHPRQQKGRLGRRWRSSMPQAYRTIGSAEDGPKGVGHRHRGRTRGASGGRTLNKETWLPS